MKKKILIFGKNSFIGSSLYTYLKNKHFVKIKSFNKKTLKYLNDFDYIINCAINKNYIYQKYAKHNDFDLQIVNKLDRNTNLIFLSTRKIYKPKGNIFEKSIIECKNNYEKNKLITEKKILKVKNKKSIILRISNLIGFKKNNPRKIHFTYHDFFKKSLKKKEFIHHKDEYKDFLDINTFSRIINLIIKKKVFGIYNVSIGEKIFLKDINSWLSSSIKNKKDFRIIKLKKTDKKNELSFYLNNSKLKKKLGIQIGVTELKKECLKLSKKLK